MGQGEALCSAPFKRSRAPRGQALATDQERPLRPAQHSARAVDAWTGSRVTVLNAKPRHDALIAQFAECAERETALTLKGGRVFVRRADFLELPKDEYYWTDLIGLQVINTA